MQANPVGCISYFTIKLEDKQDLPLSCNSSNMFGSNKNNGVKTGKFDDTLLLTIML